MLVITSAHPLANAAEAYARMMSGKAEFRVVVTMRERVGRRKPVRTCGLHARVKAGLVLCGRFLAFLDECQQIGIDLVRIGCGHPVRKTWFTIKGGTELISTAMARRFVPYRPM